MRNMIFRTGLILCVLCLAAADGCRVQTPTDKPSAAQMAESDSDEVFLDELGRRSFQYFWNTANPNNGLVPDRARTDASGQSDVASIAATGFGLTAICIADQREWIDHDQARQRVLTTLTFFRDRAEHEHGFYYHFLDMRTGRRTWNCELSSIDTALLIAGVLTAGQHFNDEQIKQLAADIYHRIDWPWMLDGGDTLSMGWKPEGGFLSARWSSYNELMLLYLLGMGSPTHPLPAKSWRAWRRKPVITYGGKTFIACPPLFTHQYSHAWIDFRNVRDDYADYWTNSVLATLAQQQMCADLSDQFPHYNEKVWGLTASDSPNGYKAWGGPPATHNPAIDGTVTLHAVGGSIAFAPKPCIASLKHMRQTYGDKIWGAYGFTGAFNPQTGWATRDVIGIDVGATLLMAENHRSQFAWRVFMRNPQIQLAMRKAGFRPTTPDDDAQRLGDAVTCSVYGLTDRPNDIRRPPVPRLQAPAVSSKNKPTSQTIQAALPDGSTASMRFDFSWDAQSLYFHALIEDDEVVNDRVASKIHEQDCVELYIDPARDGLRWANASDFQFGFAPNNQHWEWFGEKRRAKCHVKRRNSGYEIRAAVAWKTLDVEPKAGLILGVSPALYNINADGDAGVKSQWCWLPAGAAVQLGEVELVK